MTAHTPEQRRIFCSRLKEARKEQRMKQEQVARYLAIPVSAVSAMEQGNRKVDALELFLLAQLYKKPLEWFFSNHPEMDLPRIDTGDPAEDLLIAECIKLLSNAPQELRQSAARGLKGFLRKDRG